MQYRVQARSVTAMMCAPVTTVTSILEPITYVRTVISLETRAASYELGPYMPS